MRTLSSAVEQLVAEGFSANFGVVGGRLRAHDTGRTFAAHEVLIREYDRKASPTPTTWPSCTRSRAWTESAGC
jgi:hypothetical protein